MSYLYLVLGDRSNYHEKISYHVRTMFKTIFNYVDCLLLFRFSFEINGILNFESF